MQDAPTGAYAWLPAWEHPYESGLSLLAKFAWANRADADDVCRCIFGTRMTTGENVGPQGRTLLDTHWMGGADQSSTPGLLALIKQGALNSYAGRWTHRLASDRSFRFCPTCLHHGFHSSLFQIDGISRCPIHDDFLTDRCGSCGCETGFFAVTKAGMDSPFLCPACCSHYAGPFDSAAWSTLRLDARALSTLERLTRWLRILDHSAIEWEHWSMWHGPINSLAEDQARRVSTMDTLMRIIPPGFDPAKLGCIRPGPRIYWGSIRPSPKAHFKALARGGTPSELAGRKSIYKALRRWLTQQLGGCHRVRLQPLSDLAHFTWDQEVMLPSLDGCPRAQALALWRFHFEFVAGMHAGLELRPSALNWPWDGVADDRSWAAYALASFHAALAVYDSWRTSALQLPDADIFGSDPVSARELFAEYDALFFPRKLPSFPAVSALTIGDDDGKNRPLAIVGEAASSEGAHLADVAGSWCACRFPQHSFGPRPTASQIAQFDDILIEAAVAVNPQGVDRRLIAPLGELDLPASLDGSATTRGPALFDSPLAARNDIEAVELWLDRYSNRDGTFRSYRQSVEKCLVWAVAQRGKPLSSLDATDAKLFTSFLADLAPKEIWLSRSASRGDLGHWTPFKKPPSARSIDQTIRVLSLMFDWWRHGGYVRSNPWTHLPHSFAGRARAEQAPLSALLDTSTREVNYVSISEWKYLWRSTSDGNAESSSLAIRLITLLSYFGALKPREIIALTVESFHRLERPTCHLYWMRIATREAERQNVYLLPPLCRLINTLFPKEEAEFVEFVRMHARTSLLDLINEDGNARPRGNPGDSEFNDHSAYQFIHQAVRKGFINAAALAEEEGDQHAAARLRVGSIGRLSVSLEIHCRQLGLRDIALWHVVGARRLIDANIAIYLPKRCTPESGKVESCMNELRSLYQC